MTIRWIDAPAKVNLFLEVLARRPDGYHDIETVMRTVSLADRVGVRPLRRGVRFECDDPSIPGDDRNPMIRAAKAFLRRVGGGGVEIRLRKRIPAGSGLGGASSDAAATLRAMNAAFRAGFGDADLERLAAKAGSDTAFFIRGGTALCTGRGERVIPLKPRGRIHLILVAPSSPNLTVDIYKRCRPPARPKRALAMLDALGSGDAGEVGRALFNRLQAPALSNPACRAALAYVRRLNPRGAMVTGSGSAAFAIVDGGRPPLPPPPPGARMIRCVAP